MNLYTLVGALVLFLGLTDARGEPYEKYGATKTTYYTCSYQLRMTATFCPMSGRRGGDSCFCTNPNALATLAGCIAFKHRNTTSEIDYIIKTCEEYNVTLTRDDLQEAYLNYTTYAKNVSDIENFNITKPVNVPVLLDTASLDLYDRAYSQFLGNYDHSLYYGAGLLGYWLLIMLIAAIANWTNVLFPSLVKKFTGPVSNLWRKHVTLPATGRRKKTNERKLWNVLDFVVPSRFETVVLTGFLGLCIFAGAHNIKFVHDDPVFITKKSALSRYTADRTGIVASVIAPLLILFAGRNNFLQWVTRWDYATFVTYHRWLGRVVFAYVFVHAVCFSISFEKYYAEDMRETYVIWGTIATVAGGIIMVQGLLTLRRKWYEIFLLIHIIMAALFIGGAWIHVDDLGYVWFYYAASAVWIFDRAVRIARLCVFGCPKAEVILLADETLKVIVPKPSFWKAPPGGHAFVHFMRPSCFWQSHPFTFTETFDNKHSIVLYCKVKGGVTHGLYQYLASHPGRTAHIRVAIEGPYGSPTAAKGYDSAVFVAGGNGIPGIYSEVFDLAIRSPNNSKQALKLIWIVREYRSLYWFYEELLALKNTRIQTSVYITKPDSTVYLEDFNNRIPLVLDDAASSNVEIENDNAKENEKAYSLKEKDSSIDVDENGCETSKANIVATIKRELSHVTFMEGRPCMEELVHREAMESSGSTAFVTCGHPVMVDDLRAAVVDQLDKVDGKRLEFFEQLQVWA